MDTMPQDPLREYYQRREIWARKPQLRHVYARWLARMRPWMPAGPLLEVGSGSGLTRELIPEVIMTDIVALPWIDQVVDCMALPFADASMGGIVAFDMLHHIAQPHAFLHEAARVLRPGGRVLLIEPYITPLSWGVYKLCHHEDVCLKDYHAAFNGDGRPKDPWQGNLALPNLVFGRDLKDWPRLQPQLALLRRELFSLVDFQLAGGFKPRAFLAFSLFRRLVRLDDWLAPLMPLIGFRIFVVLEKRAATPA